MLLVGAKLAITRIAEAGHNIADVVESFVDGGEVQVDVWVLVLE
jgi:hypothetical protein